METLDIQGVTDTREKKIKSSGNDLREKSCTHGQGCEWEDFLKTSGWKLRPLHGEEDPTPTSQPPFLASWLYQPQAHCLHKRGSWPPGTGALQSLLLSNDDKQDVEAQDRKT